MNKVVIPGFAESNAYNRFINKQDHVNESINFVDSESQLFLLTFEPGSIRPKHAHNELRITFIRSGSMKFVSLGKETIAGPGDMLITLPNVEHSLEVLGKESLNLAEFILPEKD